jgi:HSP20 family protein
MRRDPFAELLAGWPYRELRVGRDPQWQRDDPAALVPAMDVADDDSEYTVTVEIPGVKKGDLTVEVHDGVLTIRGEKRDERSEEGKQRRYVERRFGTFSRAFTLPTDADAEHVHAAFEEGVLTIRIRKVEESKPRTVSITG